MSDDYLNELLAQTVKPERPSAVVEEDILLRLEQEIERERSTTANDAELVTLDDAPLTLHAVDRVTVPNQVHRFMSVSVVLGLAAAIVVGFLIFSNGDEVTKVGPVEEIDPPPATVVRVEDDAEAIDEPDGIETTESTPLDIVDAACGGVLPELAPGASGMIGHFYGEEAETEIRARMADLQRIEDALVEPMSQLGPEYQSITEGWDAHLGEMRNANLLVEQDSLNVLRHSLEVITGDLERVLSALVDVGAEQCGLWSEGN